jgi:hypothetical protein
VKNVLVQLDTDPHPSPFDAIVAHDAGIDVLLSYGGVTPDAVQNLVQGAYFTRVGHLETVAVWVGGSNVAAGEEVVAAVQRAFFGPFRVSTMLDSNGCNTTAATTIARLAKDQELQGKRAIVVGVGAVGLRSAALLQREGAEVVVSGIPADAFPDRPYRRARGLTLAAEQGLEVLEPADQAELEAALRDVAVVLTAGPAGLRLLPHEAWSANPSIEVLVDFNAAEPLGVEGTEATDDLVERDGKRILGALAIGGPKMKVHQACVRRLFERNDEVLDLDGVYAVATEIS